MQKPNRTDAGTLSTKINLGDLSGWTTLNIGRAYPKTSGTIACMPGNGTCVPSFVSGLTPFVSGNPQFDTVTAEAVRRMHTAWAETVAWANSQLPTGHSIIVGSLENKGPQIFVNTA